MSREQFNIRRMQMTDIAKVVEIENRSFSIPWSEKSFLESLQLPHAVFLVAEKEEQVIGYIGMYQVFQEGDITNIAVALDYRHMGAGQALISGIIEETSKIGIKDITLEVRESNVNAIHLYEKNGFENIGIRKNFYEKPKENAIIMWRKEN